MQAKGREFIEKIIKKGSLPSLSPLAVRLMELAAREDVQLNDLARVIEADPALTARLLSLVNSPLYRRSENDITNMTRAVSMLGVREVRIMALSLSLRDTLPVKGGMGLDYVTFWGVSLQRAIMAKELAKLLKLPEQEEAFTAGLLLDIGLPIMLRALPVDEAEQFPGLQVSLAYRLVWEEEEIGCTHREVGYAVVKHWGLPKFFADCILPMPSQKNLLPQVVAFADFAAETCSLPDASFTDIYLKGREMLGLDDEQVNYMLTETLLVSGQVADALAVDFNEEKDTLAVMEKVNAALNNLINRAAPQLQRVVDDAAKGNALTLQQQAVSNTLEAVMHEIRNPLMSVGGFARRLVEQENKGGGDNAKKYAQVIVDEAARLDKVLNQVSMLLAPIKPQFSKMDLLELLREAQQSFAKAGTANPSNWALPKGKLMMASDPKLVNEALNLLLDYVHQCSVGDVNSCNISLRNNAAQIMVLLFAPGITNINDAVLQDLAFGPELGLIRARRIMEALGGSLVSTCSEKGCTLGLCLSLN